MTVSNTTAPSPSTALKKTFSWISVALTVLIFAQPVLAGMGLDGDSGAITMHYHNAMTILVVNIVLVLAAIAWKVKGGPSKALWFSVLVLVLNLAMFGIGEMGGMQSLHLPLGVVTLLGASMVASMGFRHRAEAAEIAA